MKTLVLKNDEESESVARIVDVCAKNGYYISPKTAHMVWEIYSDSMAAGWMSFPDDDEILMSIVLNYTQVE